MKFGCFGITSNYRFCQRKGNPFFCHEHAPQPYIAMVSIVFGFLLSVGASFIATHIWVNTVETELKPSDLDIELVSRRHGGQRPYDFNPPKLIHLTVAVGSILVDSTLALQPRGESAFPGGRNPWQHWYYPSKRINVTFNKAHTLESLVGQKIWTKLPKRVLYPNSKNELRIRIRGKEIILNQGKEPNINYIITKEDLAL